jgi:hypothetical protein
MPAHAEQLAGRTGPGRRHREQEMLLSGTRQRVAGVRFK